MVDVDGDVQLYNAMLDIVLTPLPPFQVLHHHPNYPKIKKEIMDKARSNIRV